MKDEESQYEELGMRLKRNNVSIDIVNFAHPENIPRLQAIINAANSNGSCHFLDVPIGVAHITDVLIASPIISPDEMGDVGAGAGAASSGVAGAGAAGGQPAS